METQRFHSASILWYHRYVPIHSLSVSVQCLQFLLYVLLARVLLSQFIFFTIEFHWLCKSDTTTLTTAGHTWPLWLQSGSGWMIRTRTTSWCFNGTLVWASSWSNELYLRSNKTTDTDTDSQIALLCLEMLIRWTRIATNFSWTMQRSDSSDHRSSCAHVFSWLQLSSFL